MKKTILIVFAIALMVIGILITCIVFSGVGIYARYFFQVPFLIMLSFAFITVPFLIIGKKESVAIIDKRLHAR